MNTISKTLFWFFTIAVGFVNPLICFGLIVLYYLPGIIPSLCKSCDDVIDDENLEYEEVISQNMNDYSDDTLEEMK